MTIFRKNLCSLFVELVTLLKELHEIWWHFHILAKRRLPWNSTRRLLCYLNFHCKRRHNEKAWHKRNTIRNTHILTCVSSGGKANQGVNFPCQTPFNTYFISLLTQKCPCYEKSPKKVLKLYQPSIPRHQAVVSRDSTNRGLIGQSDHNCQKTFSTKWQHSFNL